MNPSEERYDQPEKQEARRLALFHAVESLTIYRDSSPVVTLDHFQRAMKYICDSLAEYSRFPVPHEQVKEKSQAFAELHISRVGSKKPSELQVLFLSGGQPTNDLEILIDLGVRPENIWAVEADKEIFDKAVDNLFECGYGIKIHRGGLQQFFEIVPQQFDIVYFDACGPLPSAKPSTLTVLRQLFERQRLTPLSVLITNFCQANQDGHSLEAWANRLGSWLFMRDGYEDWDHDYWKHVASNLDACYSDFVTRFVIEFAGLLMPWWRVAALDGSRREYFAPDFAEKIELAPFHEERLTIERAPEAIFSQDAFPEYRRVMECLREKTRKEDALHRLFYEEALNKVKLSDAVWLAYALRNCGDPGFSATAQLNKKCCSAKAVEVLNSFRWLDQGERLFCDEPGPHLLADLLLGLYGFPYHCNVAKQRRWRYVAKMTPMYLDVFVMDQARYFYDLVPTLPLLADRLRFAEQWVLRTCVDGIFRHARWVCPEWFFACTLAEEGVPGFQFHALPKRETIVPEVAEETAGGD